MSSVERQRRYMARLKAAPAHAPTDESLDDVEAILVDHAEA
jgi:hypothetical protein